MWAINDMFGTGTLGFAIITTILTVGTYVVDFTLLHQSAQKQAIEAVKSVFRLTIFEKRKFTKESTRAKVQGGEESQQDGSVNNAMPISQSRGFNTGLKDKRVVRVGFKGKGGEQMV
jgi:hypothetical protein